MKVVWWILNPTLLRMENVSKLGWTLLIWMHQWWRQRCSLAEHNDHYKLELPGTWEPTCSGRTHCVSEKKRTHHSISYGDKVVYSKNVKTMF